MLVDDVFTTGETVDQCVRELKRGGAREVAVLTVARTVGP
jgi:predicted amidophosphoribosyltransferase